MKDQGGYALAELILAMGVLLLLFTLAAVSGTGLLSNMRVSKETARLADNFALARQAALARYEHWMVEFPVAPAGSEVVSNYVVKSCSLLTATLQPKTCDPAKPADWTVTPKGTQAAETGVALQILTPHPSPPTAIRVIYDGMGRYTASVDVEIKICAFGTDAGGAMKCRPGGPSRTIRVRKSSGIIQSLS